MQFGLWERLVEEAVWWQKFQPYQLEELYRRASVVWMLNEQYYIQGPDSVNLTKLYEEYRVLAALRKDYGKTD